MSWFKPIDVRALIHLVLCVVLACLWTVVAQAQMAFEDVSSEANIDHQGESWSVAWGDVNGDGYQDIFVANHGSAGGAPPSLYLNQADGTFADVYQAWFPFLKRDFHGSAWVDFDNDGDQDLFISAGGSEGFAARENFARETDWNVFWRQDENGFSDEATALGLAEPLGRGRAPVWWDLNQDGLMDVILTKAGLDGVDSLIYLQSDAGDFRPCKNVFASDASVDAISAVAGARLSPSDTPHLVAKVSGLSLKLFRIEGDCRLVEVNKEAFAPLRANQFAFADLVGNLQPQLMTVRAKKHDYTSLAKPNLLVLQYLSGKEHLHNHMFSTEGRLKRVRISPARPQAWANEDIFIGAGGMQPSQRPFSLDPNNQAHHGLSALDAIDKGIAIGYLADQSKWGLTVKTGKLAHNTIVEVQSTNSMSYNAPPQSVFDASQGRVADHIFQITPDGLKDLSDLLGWTQETSCRTLVAADFDNDTDLDLYLGCQGEVANLPNRLFENLDGSGFREVLGSGSGGSERGLTDSVTAGDYDNDGFLDLFLTNGAGRLHVEEGPHQLLRNLGNENHWIQFNLVGTVSPRNAYGARIFVTAGGKTQMRDFTGGFHFGSQNDPRVHFGLGAQNEINDVVVQWPSGSLERFRELAPDQIYDLTEGQGVSMNQGMIVASRSPIAAGEPLTLIALAGAPLDRTSLKWALNGQLVLEDCIACTYTFSSVEAATMTVTGRFADGRAFSVEKSIAVQ